MQVLCQKTTKGAGISQTAIKHTYGSSEAVRAYSKLQNNIYTCIVDHSFLDEMFNFNNHILHIT